MKTLVKICGITSVNDAVAASEAGADFIGLIFVPHSPRCVSVEKARQIIEAVDPTVKKVGVFQNAPLATIKNILSALPLDMVQLHGKETVADCQALPAPVIKMIPLTNTLNQTLEPILDAENTNIDFLLLEPPKGTAHTWNAPQEQLTNICKSLPPFFLAGQLNEENVGHVIIQFQPTGIDIASGIEFQPGKKDLSKLRAFMHAVQSVCAKKESKA